MRGTIGNGRKMAPSRAIVVFRPSSSRSMPDLEEIISAVAASKKYRSICADTIRHVAARELAAAPHGSVKAAVKATKRRLHQLYGAFEHDFDFDAASLRLQQAYETGLEPEVRAACRQLMALHSSTRERLPILDRFYPAIWAAAGRPASILDLGCGLNPLAVPWMDLPAGARYVAVDIDAARIGFLNRFLVLAGHPPLARCQDILVQPPQDVADLALLLKMSPTLERQEPGATLRLLQQLRTPCIAVSFAVKSLGGRRKGMLAHYQQQFLHIVEVQRWSVKELVFETELAFVVKRGA
jgi:16S rRNA (guanine(1405)-N(7))-methyltransferase